MNGEPKEFTEKHSAGSLLQSEGYDGKLVAVAINGAFVPKKQYADTTIKDGDKIEIVAPMQGG